MFGTDVIIGTLMACPRSKLSWDLVVTKKDGVIYFDKREGDDKLDLLTVNENGFERIRVKNGKQNDIFY